MAKPCLNDISRELSRLTYCSVWRFTREAWPAQFSHFPLGIKYLTSFQWALESILLWRPPQVFALGESIGTPYLDSRVIPKSIAHTWSLSLSCSDVSFLSGTSVLMDLFCLVLHARLCQSHVLQYCVESRHRPTMPLQESFPQRIAVDQCHSFARSQVQACQGPLFQYFSHYLETGLCHNKPLHHA